MNRFTEKQLATKLLKIKSEGYPGWKKNLFGGSKIQLLRWVLFVFLLICLINVKEGAGVIHAISVLFGFLVGAIVKETILVKQIGENWSFTERVTDWSKVEAIARNEIVADDAGPTVASLDGH